MMCKTTFALYLIIICLTACKKEKTIHGTSDIITISYEKKLVDHHWETTGFSFENNKTVKIITGSEDADIIPVNIMNSMEESVGMKISVSTVNQFGLYLNETFSNLNSAETFFNSYVSAGAPAPISQTDTLKAFQVYTLKTSRNNWVKFLVKELRTIHRATIPSHYEVDIKYVIQLNGTTQFPE